jgi:hypothetical protein
MARASPFASTNASKVTAVPARTGHAAVAGTKPTTPAPGIAGASQHAGKDAIRPVNELRIGPEIATKDQVLDGNLADAAALLRFDEEPDLRSTEAVDRLHRIADGEDRSPVAWVPAGGQSPDEIELRERRVLELVDQQMRDAVIELQQEIRRVFLAPERLERGEQTLRESIVPAARNVNVSSAATRAECRARLR